MTRLEKGEVLSLYIATSKKVVRMVLVIERKGEQRLVYYTSKVLHGVDVWYQRIEKLAYAIVLTSKKLKHYF